jgi:hypothetical protein
MTLIEVVIAVTVLTIGILGMGMGFDASQRLNLVSERHAAMVHVAQREIERVEGIPYSQVGLTSAPSSSSNQANPDYYVSGSSFQWDRTAGSSETLDVDATNGTITTVQSWSEGQLGGEIYDFVTWATDPKCSPGCPVNSDYKRITVAVTMSGGLHPNPVFVSSVVSDPQSTPLGGITNGNAGNPLADPSTTCTDASGHTGKCIAGIDAGDPNTYFLHDWPATNSGTPPVPSSDHSTHPTVGAVSGLTCTSLLGLIGILSNIAGCPVPDLMDSHPPSGTATSTLYHYSSDQGTTGYPGGRLLQPTCTGGLCSSGTGGGTGSTSDCNNGNWVNTLLNVQSELWVTPTLSTNTTFTGDGGISVFSQALNGVGATVSFCIEIYDVPASGSSGIADLFAAPPVALGGAGYVAATDPYTSSNWPTSLSQVSFVFNFRGSSGPITIAAGHRLGVRVWVKATTNTPIDLMYDHVAYPAQVQLNSQ